MTSRPPHKNRGPFLAFNATFFDKHQNRLLQLLNARLTGRWFRWVLRIRRSDIGYRKAIVRLLPHAYVVAGDRPGQFIADFRTHPKFGKRIYYAFRPIWWLLHFWDWLIADRYEWAGALSFGFDTLTAYPDAGDPGTTTIDGVIRAPGDQTWTTHRDATGSGGVVFSTNASANMLELKGESSSRWSRFCRSIFLFDTSSIPDGATKNSATFSVYSSGAWGTNFSLQAAVVSSAPASNTTLADTDFNKTNFGTTEFASRKDFSSVGSSAYQAFALNSSGLTHVSLTGVTKLGVRMGEDLDNSEPTHALLQDGAGIYWADQTGTSNDPKLEVVYTTIVNVTVSAAVVALTASIPAYTISGSAIVTAAVQTISAAVNGMTFSNVTNVVITASAQAITATLNAATVSGSAIVTVARQTITASTNALTFILDAVIGVSVQILTLTANALSRIGGFYQSKYSERNTSYTSKYSERETSYSDKYTPRNL